MPLAARIRSSLRTLCRRSRSDSEMDAELRFHIESRAADLARDGLAPDEALRRARLEFGALDRVKEECRESRGVAWLYSLAQDVRFGLRMLRKSPGFTVVAVITLALGIGANAAIFSVVEGVVLAPLPYRQPDRLVMLWENNPVYPRVWDSYPNFLDWQRTAHSFEQVAAFMTRGTDLTSPGSPEHLDGIQISSGYFHTLGVNLTLGREFSSQEDLRGGAPVAILSSRVWKNRFSGSPDVLGKTVTLDGVSYTIVGVAPPKFRLEDNADVFTPLGQATAVLLDTRGAHDGIFVFARLAPGVTVQQSQAEMNAIQLHLDKLYPVDNRDLGVYVEPLKQTILLGGAEGTLLLLLGAVGVVLLIACANIASLLLARSSTRAREFAIRSALGANPARVVRQLLTESVLLSFAGAALGLLIAAFGVRSPLDSLLQTLPRSENIAIRFPVLLFTLVVSLAVGILFGLVPALKACNPNPQNSLREGGRLGYSRAQHRVQGALVIGQMALTLVLLVGAGLLFRTLRRLWDVNPGFDVAHLVTFKVGVSSALTQTPVGTRAAYQQLIDRIGKIPGVQSADFTGTVPLSGLIGTTPFWINSQKPDSLQGAPRVAASLVGPDYLRTMRIPLLRGRFFTLADTTKSPCVFVVDSVLARRYFPKSDPIGQTLSAGYDSIGPCAIVGVAGHVDMWLGDPASATQAEAYLPLYQDPDKWVALAFPYMTVVARTSLDAKSLFPALQAAVSRLSGQQTVYDFQPMRDIESQAMSSERFPMLLLGLFAGLALVLASVGIYGVISYSVAQRTHEIGVRLALGAERTNILRMVIGQGLRLAIGGLALGAIAALVLTRLLKSFSSLLYGVGANDPATLAAVSLVLLTVALAACYIPARRAMRVDPLTALRHE